MTRLLAHRGYVRLWVARVAGTAGYFPFMNFALHSPIGSVTTAGFQSGPVFTSYFALTR